MALPMIMINDSTIKLTMQHNMLSLNPTASFDAVDHLKKNFMKKKDKKKRKKWANTVHDKSTLLVLLWTSHEGRHDYLDIGYR